MIRLPLRLVFIYAAILIGASCGPLDVRYDGDIGNNDPQLSQNPNTTNTTTTTTTTSTPLQLSKLYEGILKPRCADTCHNETSGESGGLTLKNIAGENVSHENMVNIDALYSPGKKLIVAGNADDSFFIQKIENTIDSGGSEGNPMPPTGTALTKEAIELLREWINAGALNN